ncbi:related to Rab geranylgeranyltransferase alpha subunit [Melanopsichium pennsylvanicum]|uniref:Geranylgeranyl transferase type-2 subunit alpha n=2 Tax=Melanopsichium pennsylvanicum TaxID=63383 RepID=A0AAJ5C5K9_9BASI|nr:related to Rab geranylgeranyltransferase alpha subunit [Melanopsichium pennsylvanicum 4]SNX84673.1 related to Rab geranylgeranyltransferase alpha subunit [Melanopsichium pennsylvanicum]
MHGVKRQPKTAASAQAKAERKTKEAAKLASYLEIERTFFTYKRQGKKDQEALAQTTKLLTLNPEQYTVWNYRREVLLNIFASPLLVEQETTSKPDVFASLRDSTSSSPHNTHEDSKTPEKEVEERGARNRNLLQDDLSLTEHALRAHPKVYWIWNHRMWCLTQYHIATASNYDDENWIWHRELKLVEKMLDLDPRNFHGWNCRRAIIEHLALSIILSSSFNNTSSTRNPSKTPLAFPALLSSDEIVHEQLNAPVKAKLLSLAETELGYSLRKIESNFSNFSAWHQRTQLLPHLWKAKRLSVVQVNEAVDWELELVKQAMYTDPSDQSVWFYHRWLIERLLSNDSTTIDQLATKHRRINVLQQEIEVIQELFELEPDSKWCAISLAHYHQLLAELYDDAQQRTKSRKRSQEVLQKLIELDPDRQARYRDLLDGKAHF